MSVAESPQESVGVPAELRQDRIAEEVEAVGFARVTDLAERFGVSVVTVRSDLGTLEAVGRVRRVRGGAVPTDGLRHEPTLEQAARENEAQKAAIARRAAAMVQPGQVVVLDVGSTTTFIALELVARRDLYDVTIVTNGLNVAMALEPASDRISVLVTGGMVRPRQHSLVNPFAGLILEQTSAHIAFIGCNGVDAERGVTNLNFAEAEVKRAMIHAAREVVVVADGSKIGVVEAARVCAATDIDAVVTDSSASADAVAQLEQAGVVVHRA
jgi:DeoR family transcriptional regulator, aga operon transcriptional repressor